MGSDQNTENGNGASLWTMIFIQTGNNQNFVLRKQAVLFDSSLCTLKAFNIIIINAFILKVNVKKIW